jgi:signal transduction histidine kinase
MTRCVLRLFFLLLAAQLPSFAHTYTYPFDNGTAYLPSFSLSTGDSARITYTIRNSTPGAAFVVLYLFIDEMDVSVIQQDRRILIGKAGQLPPRHRTQFGRFDDSERIDRNALRIQLAAEGTTSFSVLYRKRSGEGTMRYTPVLYSEPAYAAYKNEVYVKDRPFQMMVAAFWGLMSIMLIYVLLQFMILKQHILLYYSAYLLCILLRSLADTGDLAWLEEWPFFREAGFIGRYSLTFLFWSLAFYCLFVREVLNLAEDSPRTDRVIRFSCLLFVFLGFADFFLTVDRLVVPFWRKAYTAISFGMICFAVYSLYILRLRYYSNGYVKYIFWGVFFFILMGLAVLLNEQFNPAETNTVFHWETGIYQMGYVLEILAFSSGLAKRQQIVMTERLTLQEQVIYQLKENERKHQELMRVRADIARDLHDELGSELSGISILSQVAMDKLNQPDQAGTVLSTIGETARQVMERMRDIVWNLNINEHAAGDLPGRIRAITTDLFEHTGITPQLDLPASPVSVVLVPEQWRHLSMFYKEALHNVIKHARATEVIISLRIEGDVFHLSVEDNGVGFLHGKTERNSGLKNQNHRITALKGRLSIYSVPEQGTIVSISFPVSGQALP